MILGRVAIAALSGLLLAACSSTSTTSPASPPTPPPSAQPGQPLPGGAVATDRITLSMIQPDATVQPVIDFIDGARRTLDIAVYQVDPTYQPLRQALKRAVDRDVRVRVILSRRIYPPGTPNDNPADVRALRKLGVSAELSSPSYSYAHWKTLVRDAATDQRQALICDFNLEASYFGIDPAYPKEGGTRGMAVLDTDRADIDEITKAFNADWPPYADQPPAKRPNLVWAPAGQRFDPRGNAITSLSSLISGADQTIDAYIQELPVPAKLLGPLLERAQAGVKVRIIANQGGMDDALDQLKQAGAEIRYGPAALDGSGRPMYIHSKSILVDTASERGVVFVGSENPFVNMSLNTERELGALVTDPESRVKILAVFERDFEAAQPA